MIASLSDVAIGFVCVIVIALFMKLAPVPAKVCRLPPIIHCTNGTSPIKEAGQTVGCQR